MTTDPVTTHPCDWDTDEGCLVCGLTRETMALLLRTPLLRRKYSDLMNGEG